MACGEKLSRTGASTFLSLFELVHHVRRYYGLEGSALHLTRGEGIGISHRVWRFVLLTCICCARTHTKTGSVIGKKSPDKVAALPTSSIRFFQISYGSRPCLWKLNYSHINISCSAGNGKHYAGNKNICRSPWTRKRLYHTHTQKNCFQTNVHQSFLL